MLITSIAVILLIVVMAGIVMLGLKLTGDFDRFMQKNRRTVTLPAEEIEPAVIELDQTLSDQEMLEAIHRFTHAHQHVRVLICDEDKSTLRTVRAKNTRRHAPHFA